MWMNISPSDVDDVVKSSSLKKWNPFEEEDVEATEQRERELDLKRRFHS